MPRVAVPVTQITRGGVAPAAETDGDPVNHHMVNNDGRVFLLVRNAGASPRDITFRFASAVDGQAVTPRVVAVAAGASRYFGPFPTADYGEDLQVDVAHADLKLSAYHL